MQKLDLPVIRTAGGLVIDHINRILFIFKDGKWDLPKGIIEDDENPLSTAIKETSEETGLSATSLSCVCELIPTHHLSKYKKNSYLKVTEWFLLTCDNNKQFFSPQKEEGIEHCEWIPLWDLNKVLSQTSSRTRYLLEFWLKYCKNITK
ncbi:NUDIX domain-containing protein [Puniceicoccaceae bacterium K14]|nr:NUDIX domain-containing protein [Puniceicoccaceae bacterium K14]